VSRGTLDVFEFLDLRKNHGKVQTLLFATMHTVAACQQHHPPKKKSQTFSFILAFLKNMVLASSVLF